MYNTKKEKISDIVKEDIITSCFSSKKKIMKIIGITFVPFIYAFTCILAFWNPFVNIDKIPLATISLDKKAIVCSDDNPSSLLPNYMIPKYYASNELSLNDVQELPNEWYNDPTTWCVNNPGKFLFSLPQYDEWNDDGVLTIPGILTDSATINVGFSLFEDYLLDIWKNNPINSPFKYEDSNYFLDINGVGKIKIDMITDNNEASKIVSYNDNKWEVKDSKYMMHIDIPTSFTESFINCLNAIKVKFNVDFYSKYLNDTSVNEFITYQKNYLCGEILHESSTLVTSTIITSIFSDALPLPDLDKYINEYIPNGEFATYGVGIGQLFMCVSMWVGTFAMLKLYDRDRNKKKLLKKSSFKVYISKLLPMLFVSTIQSTVLMLSLGCIGFFLIGPTFLLQYALILYAGWMFCVIVCALRQLILDEDVLSIVLIIFLVLNIACGWGTFPAFMQMQFFNILSYIMPFTYLIHAQGAIIFGIGANFDLVNSFLYLLEMLGITLIYVVVFFLIGIYSTKKIKRKYMYGSVNSTIIKQALISCNKKEYISDSKIDWKKMPKKEMHELIEWCEKNFPEEKKFKWYIKKNKDNTFADK